LDIVFLVVITVFLLVTLALIYGCAALEHKT
jgi:hypothetical protein